MINAHQKNITLEQKQRAIMDHAMIGMLGRMLDGKSVGLYESYPALFENESKQQQLNQAKQRLIQYAQIHNKKGV